MVLRKTLQRRNNSINNSDRNTLRKIWTCLCSTQKDIRCGWATGARVVASRLSQKPSSVLSVDRHEDRDKNVHLQVKNCRDFDEYV